MNKLVLTVALCLLASHVHGQGATSCNAGAGQTTASSCGAAPSMCAAGGTSAWVSYPTDPTVNATTGVFTVSYKSNGCPKGANSNYYDDGTTNGMGAPCCMNNVLPATDYRNPNVAKAAPLRASVGYSLWGANIYGPMEAGFTLGQACNNSKGILDGGVDLNVAYNSLEYQCGTAGIMKKMLLDKCGGHAGYHFHADLNCEYDVTANSQHSQIIGFGLDGRGLYGKWESSNTLPNLDACGGHVGPTPAYTFTDSNNRVVTIPAQTNAYHYHIIAGGPTTISCFGKSAGGVTLAEAKSLYSTCGTDFSTYCTSKGYITYDTDCPIFNQQNSVGGEYNMLYTANSSCPACSPNCPMTQTSTGGMTGANSPGNNGGGNGNCPTSLPPGQTQMPPGCPKANSASSQFVAVASMAILIAVALHF